MSSRGLPGRRVVLGLYAAIIAATGTVGFLVGLVVPPAALDVRLFFLVPLPPTPLSLAAFGAVTVAVALGVPLVLVALLSRRDATGGGD